MYEHKILVYYFLVVFTLFVDIYGLTFLSTNQQNTTLQVSTTNGIVQGRERKTVQGSTYFSYEGVPFAEPPLGSLRFRAPKPAKPWKGVLNATAQGSGCIELHLRFVAVDMEGTEDCLFLNVFTPANLKLSAKKSFPVLFWIYGGAFMEGSASLYGPDNLIDKEMVVVTFNYRIGLFGFLSTGDEASPGNYGLKDQHAALYWVNKNIAQFGGDPTKITIAGQSAGACSILYHMFSPKSKGLFTRAIAWSGEATSTWTYQKNPRLVAMDVGLSLGIDTANTTEMVERLRRVDIDNLKIAQMMVVLVHSVNILQDGLTFTPTIEYNHDEAFLKENPSELIKRGEFTPVPLMIGTTTMECGLFGKLLSLLRPLLILFDVSPSLLPNGYQDVPFLQSHRMGKAIVNKYLTSKSISSATNEELIGYLTDLFFTNPITNTVRTLSALTPVYFFISGHPDKTMKKGLEILGYPIDINLSGVVHAEDIPLIWNYKGFGVTSRSRPLRKTFTQLWFNFASTGNPTPNADPTTLNHLIWPPVTDNQNISYLWMGEEVNISYNYKKDIRDFWDELKKDFGVKNVL